ncbi:MAG: AMP-binding protein, partial [Desulfococcaceae bacterium]
PDLRLLVSGGAALDPGLARRLDGLGWTVATGYGLTETAPMLTVLPPGDRHFDSAGRPVQGVDLRIADDEGAEHRHEKENPEKGASRVGLDQIHKIDSFFPLGDR